MGGIVELGIVGAQRGPCARAARPPSRRGWAGRRRAPRGRATSSENRPSPPVARKSLVTSVSLSRGAIGLPSARVSATSSAPRCAGGAHAHARHRQDAAVAPQVGGDGARQLGAGHGDGREAVVERHRLVQLAVGERAGGQVVAQRAAVGQRDVGVGRAARIRSANRLPSGDSASYARVIGRATSTRQRLVALGARGRLRGRERGRDRRVGRQRARLRTCRRTACRAPGPSAGGRCARRPRVPRARSMSRSMRPNARAVRIRLDDRDAGDPVRDAGVRVAGDDGVDGAASAAARARARRSRSSGSHDARSSGGSKRSHEPPACATTITTVAPARRSCRRRRDDGRAPAA